MNQNTSHVDQPNNETLVKDPEGKLEQGKEISLYTKPYLKHLFKKYKMFEFFYYCYNLNSFWS